ncbi:MFS transporter [Pseudonocardia sp. CA-142604]|uniref:MFS transporter n=1 Tax=Pseudonocardia sp. CA-142604 TaxID=3240024 RepID=UPI003D9308F9
MSDDERPDVADQPDVRTVRRAVAGAAMGNAVEWFDYAIYSYLVTSIGLNFFPEASPAAQTMLVFAGIAIPFVLRPFGGVFLGPLGDKFGRRRVLAVTILMMSGCTFFIGLIPSYTTIGIAAPILLLLARLIQGFSTGGEYGGAATFIAEYAPDRKRGFYGSFLEFGTLTGYVLGAGIATTVQLSLSDEALNSWGWRIPFLIAGPLGLIGFYLRNRLEDTPAFRSCERAGETTQAPFSEVLRTYWPQIINLIGFVILLNVADYTLLTYMPTYLTQVLEISDTEALIVIIGVMIGMMLVIAPVGALSDRVGRKPLLLTSAVGFLVLAYPAIALVGMRDPLPVTGGMVILAVLLVLMLGTIGSALPAMFPTRNRYGGFSIGYSVSTALFGGTAPLVITALIDRTGNTAVPAFYLMGAAAVAIIPILLMPETARISISHPTQIPGTEPADSGSALVR